MNKTKQKTNLQLYRIHLDKETERNNTDCERHELN